MSFSDEVIEKMRKDLELMKTAEGQRELAKRFAEEEEIVKIARRMFTAEGRDFDQEFKEYMEDKYSKKGGEI